MIEVICAVCGAVGGWPYVCRACLTTVCSICYEYEVCGGVSTPGCPRSHRFGEWKLGYAEAPKGTNRTG